MAEKDGLKIRWPVFLMMAAALISTPLDGGNGRTPGRQPRSAECVILLHGLGRTKRSMNKLEKRLSESGYTVYNIDYPSTRHTIHKLTRDLAARFRSLELASFEKVHFVTHSMGGIVVRLYLKNDRLDNLGRVVMIAPPNQGSEVVDHMRHFFLFRLTHGPAGQQLGTMLPDSVPLSLGAVDFELGVIAGDKSANPLFSYWLGGEDDGKVSVGRTQVEGMKDFIVVSAGHTFIMSNLRVIEEVRSFLSLGEFRKKSFR